jgi:phosphoglycolate phosphatase-like HAD superfamily hydrolase
MLALSGFIAAGTIGLPQKAGAEDAPDPLPSWNDGTAKRSIIDFVRATTDQSGKDYVSPADRIATFDQDGTLWVEHPLYAQAMFALHRIHEAAPQHPQWSTTEPFKSVLTGKLVALSALTEQDWFEIVAVTHSGMSTEDFPPLVRDWLETARDPRFKRPFTDLVYQPMIEVMSYLRSNGFLTYIVTGGGQDFVRVYAQRIYGVPPERVVGSQGATQFESNGGKPVLMRLPKVSFIDDGPGKAIAIQRVIGKHPLAAFGNSDGDRQMLEWTSAGNGTRLAMLLRHDDAQREYAYGPAGGLPETRVGTFSESLLQEAGTKGWPVISMKNDWKRVFAFDG